jgi:hypothetical protein
MKLGLNKLRDEKGETETEGGELGLWVFSARIVKFCKITYKLGYLLQKENTN